MSNPVVGIHPSWESLAKELGIPYSVDSVALWIPLWFRIAFYHVVTILDIDFLIYHNVEDILYVWCLRCVRDNTQIHPGLEAAHNLAGKEGVRQFFENASMHE